MPHANPEDRRAYSRDYYRRNRPAIKASRKKYRKAILLNQRSRWARGRELVLKIRKAPCHDCGGRFPVVCMDLHHLRKKSFTIAHSYNRSIATLEKEIAKCIVLCANCHR